MSLRPSLNGCWGGGGDYSWLTMSLFKYPHLFLDIVEVMGHGKQWVRIVLWKASSALLMLMTCFFDGHCSRTGPGDWWCRQELGRMGVSQAASIASWNGERAPQVREWASSERSRSIAIHLRSIADECHSRSRTYPRTTRQISGTWPLTSSSPVFLIGHSFITPFQITWPRAHLHNKTWRLDCIRLETKSCRILPWT